MNMSVLLSGRTPKSARRQGGLVVVELAIILPVILLIMFATAEFGRAYFQYSTLTKAVQSGARYYASALNDDAIEDVDKIPTTQNLVRVSSPSGFESDGSASPGVLPSPGIVNIQISDDGNHVTVSADYQFVVIVPKLPIFGSVNAFKMSASHTMSAL